MFLYKKFAIVDWIPSAIIVYRVIFNYFWPNHFEIRGADMDWLFNYVTVSVWGEWVEEIYKSIKKKEEATEKELDERMAKNPKIEEGK